MPDPKPVIDTVRPEDVTQVGNVFIRARRAFDGTDRVLLIVKEGSPPNPFKPRGERVSIPRPPKPAKYIGESVKSESLADRFRNDPDHT